MHANLMWFSFCHFRMPLELLLFTQYFYVNEIIYFSLK